MSMRKIAFWVGLFSLVVGLITYDEEVATAPVPVVTGIIVIILAILDFIPEYIKCNSCHKNVFRKESNCPNCGKELQHEDKSPEEDPGK